MNAELVLLLGGLGIVSFYGWRLSLRFHPFAPCRWCTGRRGRNAGSDAQRWGNCAHCGGSGQRLRIGARRPR